MKKYVEEVLQPGETILFMSTIHWLIYVPGVALTLVGLLGLVSNYGGGGSILYVIYLLCLAIGLVGMFRAWFQRWITEIAVTNFRVIYKTGFIRRHTLEMNMEKVESVDVDQSILGRLFDYGDVTVHGTGQGFEPLHMIQSPIKLRNAVTAK